MSPFCPTCSTSSRRTTFMRLRPPALHHPREARNTVRAVGSAPGPSCGFDLRPSITRAKRGTRSGPSDLPLALHAASTSGPPSPARSEEHGPGRRICPWPFMRLRPPTLHHPRELDRLRDRRLLLLVVAGHAASADLGALRHEPAQEVDVLVVNPRDVLGVEDRRLLLDRAAVLGGRALLLAALRHVAFWLLE